MAHTLIEKHKYGERGQGSLAKFSDSPFWYSLYSVRGGEHRESTQTEDLKAARRFHKSRLDAIALDRTGHQKFVSPTAARVMVGELLDAYLADLKLREAKTLDKIVSAAKPIRAAFGTLRAGEVTAAKVDAFIARWQADGKANTTINRSTQLLASAFKLAKKTGVLTESPLIRKLRESNVRHGFFEADEIERVIEHLPGYLVPLVRFAYMTGWRRGEIVALRWDWVSLKAGTITLPDSKNGRARTIALSGDLAALIAACERGRLVTRPDGSPVVSDYVFHRSGRSVGDFKKAWQAALIKAGFTHVEKTGGKTRVAFDKLFHDLRRTGVRNLVRAGVRETVAMSISGHKTRSMFDRYNITSGDDQRAAFTAISAK